MAEPEDTKSTTPSSDKRLDALAEVEKENTIDAQSDDQPQPVKTTSYFDTITQSKDKAIKKSRVAIILLGVLLVSAVAIIGLGAYMYFKVVGENNERRDQVNSLERTANNIDEMKKEIATLKKEKSELEDDQDKSSTSSEKMEKDLAAAKKLTTEQQTTIDTLNAKIKTLERAATVNGSSSQSQSPSTGTTTPSTN